MGGIGKTELVRKYLSKYHKRKCYYFNYSSSIRDTLLVHRTNALNDDLDIEYQNIKIELGKLNKKYLLYLDDVNNIENNELAILRGLNCQILITSREKINIDEFADYEIQFLNDKECRKLFRSFINKKDKPNDEELDEIIHLAGNHTLAVELLAKTYENSPQEISINELTSQLEENGFNLPKIGIKKVNNQNIASLYEHFQKLFDVSNINDEKEIHILKNICLLPSYLIKKQKLMDWLGLVDDIALMKLHQRGWIQFLHDSFSMHNVLSETLKLSLKPTFKDCETLIESLANEINFDSSAIERYNPPYFSQCVSVADYFSKLKMKEEILARIFNNLAGAYRAMGDYPKALGWHEKALEIREKVLGKEHPDTAMTYNNLALVYSAMGDYPKALGWYEKALIIVEKMLGKEHPSTATTYNNLAEIYRAMGDYPKALGWHEKALEIREKMLGKEHPDMAMTYNNLAEVYREMGDYPKALGWHEKALIIVEKVLGKEHPFTATTYNNLALVYRAMGDYPKALGWYEKALEIKEKVLGKEHPFTATTYNNLAGVYNAMGDYPKALGWYEKALIIVEKVLGKEHPDTAVTYNNLAGVYESMGDYPKALGWYGKAIIIFVKKARIEHPNTKIIINNTKICYLAMGHTAEEFEEWLANLLSKIPPPPTQT